MIEPSVNEKLHSEEDNNTTESLFSKKFREYLTTKKLSTNHGLDKFFVQKYKIKPFAKDYSESSSETTSESSKKSLKKPKKKVKEKSYWNIQYTLRNRLVQCNLLQSEEEVVMFPESLKPLLLNITILLQDLKQTPSANDYLYNLISKITLLVSQFVRRPLQKISDADKSEHTKNAENTVELMKMLLEDYKNDPNLGSDNTMREYKRIEKEIQNKKQEINELMIKLNNTAENTDLKVKDLELRVKNSFLANENLKFCLKFNQNRLKKYKKVLLEKEWTKHKLESELAHFKKKISKPDLSDNESLEKQSASSELSLKSDILSKIQFKNTSTKIKKGKKKNVK